jgi:ribosomal protein S18 acetylase RimI-like enzyme
MACGLLVDQMEGTHLTATRDIASIDTPMTASIVSRSAAELMGSNVDPETLISHGLPWVVSAGRAYYNWLCGGKNAAERAVALWMRRSDSEVSLRRMQFFLCDSKIAAGIINMGGADLKKARTADVDSLWETLDVRSREAFIEKLSQSADLFAPVAEDEYYGSKMGITPSFRGQSLAPEIMRQSLDRGNALGYSKFRLDVQAGNKHAIRLYLAFGFEIFYTGQSTDGALKYYGMRFERKGK